LLSKRALQFVVAIGGFVPVGAGLAGIVMGPDMIMGTQAISIPLDSHFRYLSGLLLGIGFAYWAMIPDIESKGRPFHLLTAIVFIGGLARLMSLFTVGIPDHAMLFGLGMELIVTPLIAFWQYRVEKRAFGAITKPSDKI
jgi:hypothetical protein